MAGELVIHGHQFDDTDQQIAELRAEVRRLRVALAESEGAVVSAKSYAAQTVQGVAGLRKQLTPLYRALQAVFGEFDALGVSADDEAGVPRKHSAIWDSWKEKMPGMPARFIQVLLEHGDMNAAQLRIAAKCGNQTVYDTIHKLNKAGLIEKNGGRFSLKKL